MSKTTEARDPLLKKLLDILNEFNPAEDIWTHLAKPDNLKVIDEMDRTLKKYKNMWKNHKINFYFDSRGKPFCEVLEE